MFHVESVVWANTQVDIMIEGLSFASSVHRHITHAADCSVHTNTPILVYALQSAGDVNMTRVKIDPEYA